MNKIINKLNKKYDLLVRFILSFWYTLNGLILLISLISFYVSYIAKPEPFSKYPLIYYIFPSAFYILTWLFTGYAIFKNKRVGWLFVVFFSLFAFAGIFARSHLEATKPFTSVATTMLIFYLIQFSIALAKLFIIKDFSSSKPLNKTRS